MNPCKCLKLVLIPWVILLISCSMAMAADWDNVKEYDPAPLPYGEITVHDWLGFGSTLAEYTLTSNTDTCGTTCFTTGKVTLYEPDAIFSDVKFLSSITSVEKEIPYQFFLIVNESREEFVLDPCTEPTNFSNECTGAGHYETRYYDVDLPYTLGTVMPAGTYNWKIKGVKKEYESIDWVGTALGKEFTEWIDWLSANFTFDSNNQSMSFTTNNGRSGFIFSANVESTLQMVLLHSYSDEINGCVLVNRTGIQSRSGNIATGLLNVTFTQNNTLKQGDIYRIECFNGADPNAGGDVSRGHLDPPNPSFPINRLNINYILGSLNGANRTDAWDFTEIITSVPFPPSAGNAYLNTPADKFNSSLNAITFNCTGNSSTVNIHNLTLIIDNSSNYTVTGSASELTLQTTLNIAQGTHSWSCNTTNENNQVFNASTRTLEVDTEVPTITVTSYNSTIIRYSLPTTNTSINWTVTDIHSHTSFISYNGANYSAQKTGNDYYLNLSLAASGNNTLLIYANDSNGNIARTTLYIYVFYVQITSTESSNVLVEGQRNVLTLYVNLTSVPETTATLWWNNTNYGQGTRTKVTDDAYQFVNTFYTPNIGSIAGQLVAYYWTYNITSLGIFTNSTEDNQTVKSLNLVTDCSDTNNGTVINFTINYEPEWGDSFEGNFTSTIIVWTGLKTVNRTFNINRYNVPNFTLCLYPNNTIFYADMRSELSGTSYASRTYFINNVTLNSTKGGEIYVDLYQLATASGTVTNVYTYDAQDNGLPNKYVSIYRYDVSTNQYKLVEIVKTDDVGHAVAFLRQNDAFYKFIVMNYSSNVELISDTRQLTTNNVQLYPGQSTFTSLLEDVDGIYHTLSYNASTLTFSAEFVGTTRQVTGCLLVEKKNMIGITEVCNSCTYGLTGSLACTIDNTTGTYHATFYNKINPYGVWNFIERVVSTSTKLTEKIGLANANFLCMLIVLVIALASSFNPVACVISTTVSVAALVGMGLFDLGLTSFLFIVLLAIVLVTRLKS